MVIAAAAESSSASIWATVFAGAAFIASVLFGFLNLRRAARGPDGAPAWELEHQNKARYALLQNGNAPAYNVTVEISGAPRVDGTTSFDQFDVGQRASFLVTQSWQSDTPQVTVTWQDAKKKRHTWVSDLP